MEIYAAIIYFSTALLTIFLGGVVVANNFKKKINLLFFAFCVSVSLWIVLLYVALFGPSLSFENFETLFMGRMVYASSIIFPIFIPFFFYYFPRRILKFPRIVFFALGLIYLALIYITGFTPLVLKAQIIENGIWVADEFGPLQPLYMFYIVAQMAFGLVLAIYQLKNTTGIERTRIKLAAGGFFVFYALGMIFNVILPLFGVFLLQNEVVLFVLFFIIPTFQSIQKYRFFEFTGFSFKILRSLFLLFIFIIFSEGILILLEYNFPQVNNNHLLVVPALLVGLMLFCFLAKKFPDFTSKDLRDLKNVVAEVKLLIYYCKSFKDLQALMESRFVEKLHFSNIKVFAVRDQIENIDLPQYIEGDFTKALANYDKQPLIIDELDQEGLLYDKDELLRNEMKNLDAQICFPLFAEGNLIGFVSLGYKNNFVFRKEAISELTSMIPSLEICMMNILIQNNLQRENNLMKKIIDEKTDELKSKIRDIKQLVNQQSDFIAVTAHEFRTPLSIALFQLEDVMNSEKMVKEIQEDMQTVEEALINLQNLSQKLFDVHKYDLNKMTTSMTKINLEEFLLKIYKDFKYSSDERNINLEYLNKLNSSPFANIDVDQIRQVLINLLVNALKFSPSEGGKIQITLTEDGEYYIIQIADNGKGIKDEDKLKIFDKFNTGDGDLGKGHGIGLGLYLCKKIIDAHNGMILVEDNINGGAVFSVFLKKISIDIVDEA